MSYKVFDINTWNRKEHYNFYKNQVRCSFSLSTKINITELISFTKSKQHKFYPVIIHLLAKAVNTHPEFRFAIKDGELILWETLNPSYTVLHPETETFSEFTSLYCDDLNTFMEHYNSVELENKGNYNMFPQQRLENTFNISMLPWVSFDGFNLNLPDLGDYFAPIFTLGKYYTDNSQILLPISIQVHHATCDGLHVAKFINTLQELCDTIGR